MYLGESSLTVLYHFMQGYEMASWRCGNKNPPEVPEHFADWVGYRLHLDSNWSGFWHRAILSRIRDEHQALLRFYELRDEFFRREARVVATIRKDCREHKVGRYNSEGKVVDCVEKLPESLTIVVYTEDPGFFLVAEESDPFVDNGWFFPALSTTQFSAFQERFEIHDQITWGRLLAENKKYKKNLTQRRARIQKRERRARDARQECH
jgi:hypothetical protein